jgi:hypothetical protein
MLQKIVFFITFHVEHGILWNTIRLQKGRGISAVREEELTRGCSIIFVIYRSSGNINTEYR